MKINAERFKVMDKLTKLELATLYNSMAPAEKVELIKELVTRDALSVDAARIVLADKTKEARVALARYTNQIQFLEPPELDLEEAFKAEEDELVKCALYENPEFLSMRFGSDQLEIFNTASPIQRLALMRNSRLDHELILKIYDYENKEIVLEDQERLELIRAFSTNHELIENSKLGFGDHDDGLDSYLETDFYKKLWEAALKWLDKKPEIPYLTFKNFGVDEEIAHKAYDGLKDKKYTYLRAALMENPRANSGSWLHGYDDLFKKGLEDGWVRHKSAASLEGLSKVDVEKLISRNDKDILRGLLHNKHLDRDSMHILEAADKSDLEIWEYKDFSTRYEKIRDIELSDDEDVSSETSRAVEKLHERLQENGELDLAEMKALILNLTKLQATSDKRFEKVTQQLESLRTKVSWILWLVVAVVFMFIVR